MAKNIYLDQLIAEMLAHPQMRQYFHMAYPKRIVPPHGYMNPRYFAPTTASSIHLTMNEGKNRQPDFVSSVIFFITRKLTLLNVPTFFIGQEFAEAIWETDLESEMRSDEITWPDEAMLFVLPEKFSRQYLGYHIPFLALAHYSAEEVRGMTNLQVQKPDGSPAHPDAKKTIDGQVFMNFQWHSNETEPGIDYVSSWPLTHTLASVAAALQNGPLSVMTEEKEAIAAGKLDHVGMKDEAIERDLLCKMRDFSAKLLMAMTDEPMFVERGKITRPNIVKRGVLVREELWSPNMLGGAYRHPYAEGIEPGTHSSPMLHRRRGHHREQAHGPGMTLRKRKWIKPMWIGAKAKDENKTVGATG